MRLISVLDFSVLFCLFVLFVYLIFYRKQHLSTKLTALYRGEAVKFALTILCIIAAFKGFHVSEFILFLQVFCGISVEQCRSIFAEQVLILSFI